MSTLRNTMLLAAALFFCTSVSAQMAIAYNGGKAYVTNKAKTEDPSETNEVFRFHKKLPSLYEGFAIEVASSDYPLDRTDKVFRQFGGIHYDKLDEGGYSYLVLGRFSDEESALSFLQNVVIHRAKEARVVRYKEGNRSIVREES
jgi:hypothetical protein